MLLEPITIDTDTTLEVVSKYQELSVALTDVDSMYLKAKETLDELFKTNTMTAVDKANIISTTLSNITIQSSQMVLNTALQWCTAEKQVLFDKMKLSYELQQINQGSLKIAQDTLNAEQDNLILQAQLLRLYGRPTLVNGAITALDDTGKIYEETRLIKQQVLNEEDRNEQITAQTEELYARIHQLVADTYVNHGVFNGYALSPTGLSGITKVATGHKTLSELNALVGAEQAKGYVYNAWANAVSSSASMLATLISTESNVDYTGYLTKWNTAIDKLNGLVLPNVGA